MCGILLVEVKRRRKPMGTQNVGSAMGMSFKASLERFETVMVNHDRGLYTPQETIEKLSRQLLELIDAVAPE